MRQKIRPLVAKTVKMDGIKHTAIVVKAIDYKDNDKLLSLLTVDAGVVTAVIRGVKKPKAKLKFAAQPFAFCEYTFAQKGGFMSVTSASQIESLHKLCGDIDIYMAAALMIECVSIDVSTKKSPERFLLLLNLYKELIFAAAPPKTTASWLLYRLMLDGGYFSDGNIFERALGQVNYNELDRAEHPRADEMLTRLVKKFQNEYGVKLSSANAMGL